MAHRTKQGIVICKEIQTGFKAMQKSKTDPLRALLFSFAGNKFGLAEVYWTEYPE